MSAIPVHVALVDETDRIGPAALAEVAGALNEQVQADFAPAWHVRATVGAYPADAVPPHTWKVVVKEQLDEPGALGYHADDQLQPYAFVDYDGPDWTVTASHEVVEMLADPFGRRMHAARLPTDVDPEHVGLERDGRHVVRVHYLVEVADPPEMRDYEIGGVKVSDFILPAWYRTNPPKQAAYSHTGYCSQPRQIASGGYASFVVADGTWWQVFNHAGALVPKRLGRFDRGRYGSLREFTDHHARMARAILESP